MPFTSERPNLNPPLSSTPPLSPIPLGWQSPERESWRMAILDDAAKLSFATLNIIHKAYCEACTVLDKGESTANSKSSDLYPGHVLMVVNNDLAGIRSNILYWAENVPACSPEEAAEQDAIMLREYSTDIKSYADGLAALLKRRPDLATPKAA